MSDILFFSTLLALINALLFGLYLDSHGICKCNWMVFTYFPINYLPLLFTYYLIERLIYFFSYYLYPNTHEIADKNILAFISDDKFIYFCWALLVLSILYKILFCVCRLPWNYNISSTIINLNAAIYRLIKIKFKWYLFVFTAIQIMFGCNADEFGYKDLNIASGTSIYLAFTYLAFSEIFSCSWYNMTIIEEYNFTFIYWLYSIIFFALIVSEILRFFQSNFCKLSEFYNDLKELQKQRYEISEISGKVSEPYSFAIYFSFSLFLSYYFIDDILSDFWIFKELLYFAGWLYVGGLASSRSLLNDTRWNFILNASSSYAQYLAFIFIKNRLFW